MTRPSRAARCAAALALAAVVAPALGAQQVPVSLPGTAAQVVASRPTTPFRKGQWGMEFGTDLGGAHLGFVKFRSPTKAWVLDLGVNGTLGKSEGTSTIDGTLVTIESSRITTTALLGIRSYKALTPRAVRTLQFGLLGGHDYEESEGSPNPFQGNGTTFSGGLRFDLGGAYFFTPGFSLGGTLAIGGQYRRSEYNSPTGTSTAERIDFGLDGSRVAASLYF